MAEVGEFFADYLIPGHLDSKLNKTIKINNPNDNEENKKTEKSKEINEKDKDKDKKTEK